MFCVDDDGGVGGRGGGRGGSPSPIFLPSHTTLNYPATTMTMTLFRKISLLGFDKASWRFAPGLLARSLGPSTSRQQWRRSITSSSAGSLGGQAQNSSMVVEDDDRLFASNQGIHLLF